MKTAVYCATRNLYADLLPSVKSLSMHSDVEQIFLLIEDDSFPFPLPPWVRTVNVAQQPWIRKTSPNWDNGLTWMVMIRACLTKLLPDCNRVLSIDCDTICTRDVSEIFELDLGGSSMAMTREPSRCAGGVYYQRRFGDVYYNAGVCLQDLKALREHGDDDRIIDMLNSVKLPANEQDAFNLVLRGKIRDLPNEFNSSGWTGYADRPRILHYAGVRDWQHLPPVETYRAKSWEEVLACRS